MTAPDRTLPYAGSRRQLRNHPWQDYALFFVLVGPNLALLILFVHRPLIDNIRLSFYDWNFASPSRVWLGLGNYREWWHREDSWEVVRNTLTFSVFAVAGSMVLGLALAMLLDQKLRGRNLARGVIFAPYVLSGAAVGLAAQFVFDPRFGFVQDLLRRVGITSPNFYQDPEWALFMVTVTYIWKNLGYTFVIYLAALQGVRQDLMEAAQIDGAGPLRTFRRVLLPQLRPTTFFLSITVILNSLQVFDLINTMTRGGPLQNATTTMVYQVYVESFRNLRPGYGSTVATIMFAALLVITVIQVRVMDRADAR